eukprot:7385459-Prymnesium_polylepis.1
MRRRPGAETRIFLKLNQKMVLVGVAPRDSASAHGSRILTLTGRVALEHEAPQLLAGGIRLRRAPVARKQEKWVHEQSASRSKEAQPIRAVAAPEAAFANHLRGVVASCARTLLQSAGLLLLWRGRAVQGAKRRGGVSSPRLWPAFVIAHGICAGARSELRIVVEHPREW